MVGVLGQRRMERDHIGSGETFLQRRVAQSGLSRESGIGSQIPAEHVHTETTRNAHQTTTNGSRAQHRHGLAVEVEADQTGKLEIAFTHPCPGAMRLAVEGQQQCHGMFGHRVRTIGRYSRHRQTGCAGRDHIDIIVSSATHR